MTGPNQLSCKSAVLSLSRCSSKVSPSSKVARCSRVGMTIERTFSLEADVGLSLSWGLRFRPAHFLTFILTMDLFILLLMMAKTGLRLKAQCFLKHPSRSRTGCCGRIVTRNRWIFKGYELVLSISSGPCPSNLCSVSRVGSLFHLHSHGTEVTSSRRC